MFESVLKFEIDQIVWLQNVAEPLEPLLEIVSALTKTAAVNIYLLPLCLAFDVHLFTVLMLVSNATSYTMHMLKWVLADSRPYWWLPESEAYGLLERPVLRQSALTCETSAGNPSGHVMLNAACWYVLIHRVLQSAHSTDPSTEGSRLLPRLCWSLYAIGVLLVSVSRMYFACHFLHQCVLGAGLGFAMSRYMLHYELQQRAQPQPPLPPSTGPESADSEARLSVGNMICLTLIFVAMTSLALGIYFGLIAYRVDPALSIRMACLLGCLFGYGLSCCGFHRPQQRPAASGEPTVVQPVARTAVIHWLLGADKKWLGLMAVAMAAVAVAVYWVQIALHIDPLWSIRTAFNWCQNPANVHPETTTMYCIIRDLGLFCGLILQAPLSRHNKQLDLRYSVPLVSGILVLYMGLSGYVPRHDGVLVFYACTFLLNMTLVAGLLEAVSRFCTVDN